MSANDNTEKVLRQLHVLLSKSEPYSKEPSKVIVDKQQMIDLLSELNKCIYAIQDEYELTTQSRDRAEREFKKKGNQIVWDASRQAEDVYAASVMYTNEVLNRVWDIMHETDQRIEKLQVEMREKLKEEEQNLKKNQSELKGTLNDLRDTEKYLRLIEDRNREIQRQKKVEKGKEEDISETSIYANRQTEIKINTDALEKLGLSSEKMLDEGVVSEVHIENKKVDSDSEAAQKAELDADYFQWKKNEGLEGTEAGSELAEGIQKIWKSIKGSKK